jgi:hypothetical protein
MLRERPTAALGAP